MELRKSLKMNENDMVEIFVNGEVICLKKRYESENYLVIAESLAKDLAADKEQVPNADEIKEHLDKIVKLLQKGKN